jgi:hypothetical protein
MSKIVLRLNVKRERGKNRNVSNLICWRVCKKMKVKREKDS